MGDKVIVTVECYSGSAYAERPKAIYWQGRRHEINEVLKSWQTPAGKAFAVRLESGLQVTLNYDQAADLWTADGLT